MINFCVKALLPKTDLFLVLCIQVCREGCPCLTGIAPWSLSWGDSIIPDAEFGRIFPCDLGPHIAVGDVLCDLFSNHFVFHHRSIISFGVCLYHHTYDCWAHRSLFLTGRSGLLICFFADFHRLFLFAIHSDLHDEIWRDVLTRESLIFLACSGDPLKDGPLKDGPLKDSPLRFDPLKRSLNRISCFWSYMIGDVYGSEEVHDSFSDRCNVPHLSDLLLRAILSETDRRTFVCPCV